MDEEASGDVDKGAQSTTPEDGMKAEAPRLTYELQDWAWLGELPVGGRNSRPQPASPMCYCKVCFSKGDSGLLEHSARFDEFYVRSALTSTIP